MCVCVCVYVCVCVCMCVRVCVCGPIASKSCCRNNLTRIPHTVFISQISVRLNCTATSGCSKDKTDALRENLDVYKKFQNALDTLLGVASDQGLTDGISETDWIRKYVICKGNVAQATVSTVAHLYPSLNVTHSC